MAITLDSLDSSLHSVEVRNAAGQALAIDGSGYITANINGTVTVTATDLDIRDLLFASDSVDVTGSTVGITGTVQTAPAGLDVWQTSSVSATATAGEIAATPLANRLRMIIQNVGTGDVYLGEDNTVTDTTGICLPKGSSFEFPYGVTANIWAICATGKTATLRVAEYAD